MSSKQVLYYDVCWPWKGEEAEERDRYYIEKHGGLWIHDNACYVCGKHDEYTDSAHPEDDVRVCWSCDQTICFDCHAGWVSPYPDIANRDTWDDERAPKPLCFYCAEGREL